MFLSSKGHHQLRLRVKRWAQTPIHIVAFADVANVQFHKMPIKEGAGVKDNSREF